MKRILLITVLFVASITLQGQFTYFNNRYYNDQWCVGLNIMENENGYMVSGVGGEESQGYVFKRIFMTSLDEQGNQLFFKTYGEDWHNYYVGQTYGCVRTSDNGFMVSGTIEDSIRSVGLILKFDQNGDSLWSGIFGDTISPGYSATSFNACKQLPDKGYLMAGGRYISGDDGDILLIRTDSLGNKIWEHSYGVIHRVETGFSIAQLPGGEFLIGIQRQNLNMNYSADPGLLKVDSLGNQIWIRYYGSTMDDWGCAVEFSQDGNYLVGSAYCTSEPGPGWPLLQPWIFKTDTSGNILWQRKIEGPRFTGQACTIDELDDGSIISAGEGGFDDCGSTQGYIVKLKQNGDSIWMRRYNYYPLDYGYLNHLLDFCITNDHGMIFTGETFGDPDWEQSIWVQKLDSIGCDSAGCDTTVEIAEWHWGMEAWKHGGIKIYPNPAKDRVNISFQNFSTNWFSVRFVEIYNMMGEKVLEIKIPSRSEIYSLDVSGLTDGIYLLVIREGQIIRHSAKLLISK
jgi:hypothetical protein